LAYTLIDSGRAYSVEKGTATASEVVIPKTYNRLPVKEIAERGFRDYSQLKSIRIPNSVTKINDRAFEQCSNLVNIQIPNSVTSIGYNVFKWCRSLTSITLPQGITSIEKSMFDGCPTSQALHCQIALHQLTKMRSPNVRNLPIFKYPTM
jgi:hypothetical protein